jgi:lipopolysaccharide transport system ATP-binding protein
VNAPAVQIDATHQDSGVAAACGEPALRLRAVGKRYRMYRSDLDRLLEIVTGRPRHQDVTALSGIDLTVGHGEVLGIVGRNGAGKSTLLKLIAGMLPASEGSIDIQGRVGAILELGAAFHPEMSGRENVYLKAAIAGLTRAEIDALMPEIAAFADIGAFIERPVKTYSSGMSARLAFAVATAIDPDILIIDEALSVGDGAFARKSFDRIMAFRDAGKTILFCSHSLYHVEAICNRAVWIDQGRIRREGSPAAVLADYRAELERADTASAQESTGVAVDTRQRPHESSPLSSAPTAMRAGH